MIAIGSGSAMSIVNAVIRRVPEKKVAVIDKDDPGGICLTRGCIPSKILLYPAELVRTVQKVGKFGLELDFKDVDFEGVMERMRKLIDEDIKSIRHGLSSSDKIDYYSNVAEFTAPYTLKVGGETIRADMIFLCTGSKPNIPPIKGLKETGYLTSNTVLNLKGLPESIAIVGGGYIAAEYGHFFSAMGSEVTIIGRNPQFLPQEEPEISALAEREFKQYMTVMTNHEVQAVEQTSTGAKRSIALNRENGEEIQVITEEILVATGRSPNTDVLQPEKGEIETDSRGWIKVDEHLETSQPNIWALGDANGNYLFKHVANYEAEVVYNNALLNEDMAVDYHAIPHAVFSYPEISSVGLREEQAIDQYGQENVLIGIQRYQDTAKGEAMGLKDYFVKVLVEKETLKILGAHIIGPYASVLIQEIINLMYTPQQSAEPIMNGMHIHPALNEVVERAFYSLMPPEKYHHTITEHFGLLPRT